MKVVSRPISELQVTEARANQALVFFGRQVPGFALIGASATVNSYQLSQLAKLGNGQGAAFMRSSSTLSAKVSAEGHVVELAIEENGELHVVRLNEKEWKAVLFVLSRITGRQS